MLRELVAYEPGKPVLQEYQDEPLRDGYVRIKVDFGAPKHGTELVQFRGINPFLTSKYDKEYQLFLEDDSVKNNPYFMRMGNMWVGSIIEKGDDIKHLSVGERVAGYGPLRSTQIIEAKKVMKMRDRMTWKEAVCFDPALFALGGIRDGHVRMGDAVVVFGLGAIGLIAAQMAKLSGSAAVIVVDPIARRREAAMRSGADLAIDPNTEDAGLEIKKACGSRGADTVIETSGSYSALHQAIRGLAYEGNVAVVGWYKECKSGINLGLEAHFNQPNIILSRACSEPNRDYPRWNFDRIKEVCWEMLSRGDLKCEDIVDPVVNFDESPQAYIDIDFHPEKSIKLGVEFT